MAFRGKEPIRTKILINDRTLELAVSYTHLDVYKRQECTPWIATDYGIM